MRNNMVNKIIQGDCLEQMKTLEDNSVDSIVTDPPFGWSFMGKKWDYDVPSVEVWKEALRVLKPGGHALVACGTRTQHRMAVNLEDAGFEIRDIVAYVYGSGFPKSLNISKSIEKHKNIKPIGKKPAYGAIASRDLIDNRGWNNINNALIMPKTQTKEGKQWEGWGTALKPATECWTWATKPLEKIKENAIIDSIENSLYELVWQSLEKSQKRDTFKLLEMGLIPLSIVLLWHSILEELSKKESKSTTLTESKQIIELKILNSLLLKNMQEDMGGEYLTSQNGMKESQRNGLNALANIAVRVLGDLNHTKSDWEIITLIATEIATLKTRNTGLNVPIVDKDLEMLNAIVSSVLQNVLISLIDEQNKERLNILVKFAEKLLQLSLVENQNTVVENVWQKLSPNLSLWTLCRKPLSEKTVAENVLKWGTGGINIDRCRVTLNGEKTPKGSGKRVFRANQYIDEKVYGDNKETSLLGRFPANLIHDGSEEVVELFPNTGKGNNGKPYSYFGREYNNKDTSMFNGDKPQAPSNFNDSGSASRFFYCAKASVRERNAGLCDIEEQTTTDGRKKDIDNALQRGKTLRKNSHPTVKPLSLMRYLCRLITPPQGVVLDPYMGSGTTGMACKEEGFNFIGIELEPDYVKIAEARIKAVPQTLFNQTKGGKE